MTTFGSLSCLGEVDGVVGVEGFVGVWGSFTGVVELCSRGVAGLRGEEAAGGRSGSLSM